MAAKIKEEIIDDIDDFSFRSGEQENPGLRIKQNEIPTYENDEEPIVALPAKIYRADYYAEVPDYKLRGSGIVKILRHKKTNKYRVFMVQEFSCKICANHYITSQMKLEDHPYSNRVFTYATIADLYKNKINPELFTIKFPNVKFALKFKKGFEEAVNSMINKRK